MLRKRWLSQLARPSPAHSRSLAKARYKIWRTADKLWPGAAGKVQGSLRDEAEFIFRKALTKTNLVRRFSVDEVAVASLYASCRIRQIGRSIQEFSEASGIPRLGRVYRRLVEDLDLQRSLPNAARFVGGIANKVCVSDLAQRLACEILIEAAEDRLTIGRKPSALAAAALYYAASLKGERMSRHKLAKAAGSSSDAVRENYVRFVIGGLSRESYILPVELTLSPHESATVYIPIAAKRGVRLKVIVDWRTEYPPYMGNLEI
jgi:transcription initiation factor TFIIB